MTPQEKVFISYCSEDIQDAVRLQKELKKAGITCWVSNDSLLPRYWEAGRISRVYL